MSPARVRTPRTSEEPVQPPLSTSMNPCRRRAEGGLQGGVFLKHGALGLRATQKTESPRRGPWGGARRRARGIIRGGQYRLEMAIDRGTARSSPPWPAGRNSLMPVTQSRGVGARCRWTPRGGAEPGRAGARRRAGGGHRVDTESAPDPPEQLDSKQGGQHRPPEEVQRGKAPRRPAPGEAWRGGDIRFLTRCFSSILSNDIEAIFVSQKPRPTRHTTRAQKQRPRPSRKRVGRTAS